MKPDSSQDAAASTDSQPPSRATASLVAAIAPSLPTGPVRSESGVRAVQRSGASVPGDDEDTAVDAAPSSKPLTEAERASLTDQIAAALEKTLTPVSPVSGVVPAQAATQVAQRPPPRKVLDHEAFALARPISVPPPAGAQRDSGIMLPPPPQPGDMVEPEPAPVAASPALRSAAAVPSAAPTRPPVQASVSAPRVTNAKPAVPEWRPPSLSDMPSLDPFAGFVRPPPSALQRFGMALLIALAVVGLCALVAIGFGYLGLGKISWPPFGQ